MNGAHDYDHEGLCRRCGIGEAWVDYRPFCGEDDGFPKPRRNPGGVPCGECHIRAGETCDICGAVEPQRAPPAPAIADMLDRALSRGAFDLIDRRHKP